MIFISVIERYINMGTAQYLRDFRRSYDLKKSAELRKRVLQKQQKNQEKSDSVPFKVSYIFIKLIHDLFISLWTWGEGGRGVLPYMSYMGMCRTLGCDFRSFLV